MAVANLEDPSALAHLIAGALRIQTEEKQALLEEVDVAQAAAAALGDPRARARDRRDRLPHPVAGPVRDGPLPARVRPAPAAQGDPGGARRARPRRGRGRRPARAARAGGAAGGGAQAGRPRARAAREAPAGGGRARRDPHLPRVDRLAAVGQSTEDNLDLAHARGCSTPTTTTSRRSRTGSSSSSPCESSEPDARGSIMCFVGPPGVGKTSLGRSIAERDGPQVRAHQRRRRARRGGDPRPPPHLHRRDARDDHPRAARRGLQQPAVHDRRDRQDGLGLSRRPGISAMLEVLDPEQNATFRDHYLDVPFDLSRVMFVTTANTLDTIPGPLRDRMEVIQLAGYTEEEKLQIAKRYLVPRQIDRSGLKRTQISFTDRSPRSPAITISIFCWAVQARYLRCSLNLHLLRLSGPSWRERPGRNGSQFFRASAPIASGLLSQSPVNASTGSGPTWPLPGARDPRGLARVAGCGLASPGLG